MEFFRVSRNVWGQEVLQGVSWDWVPVFFAAGLTIIVCHALYRLLAARRS